MDTLYGYRFPDGTKAYFVNGDRKSHIVVKSSETFFYDDLIKEFITKKLKISYENWKKRYAS